jgi:hypothetical protein
MSCHSRTVNFALLVISAWALSAAAGLTQTPVYKPPPHVLGDCGKDDNGAKTGKVGYVAVYSSHYAKWCVDATFWQSNSESISDFFAYYDEVVPQLSSLFKVTVPLPIVVEVTTPTPGACACGPRFGVKEAIRISGDAFSSRFVTPQKQSVPGFWGYLLTLHETINVFTGQVGGGNWPTDWWADHRSPFPNAMDEQVMRVIGTKQNNPTLLSAAAAHHQRFGEPGQGRYDSEVAMFNDFYNQFGGFAAYSLFFSLVQQDKMQWKTVAKDPTWTPDNNESALLSEYLIGYLSLAFGTTSDLTPVFVQAGVGTKDDKISPYTVSSAAVKDIANAHCSIRAAVGAGHSASRQLIALQNGDYSTAIASGGTSGSCPHECSWNQNQNKCVAKW